MTNIIKPPAPLSRRGRPSNREERRRQIAGGLLAVMAAEGYARATIVAIAREAALTPGLLHHHFASKHEILISLVAQLRAGLEARVEARQARAGDAPLARLHALLDAHLALGADADPRAVAAWVVIGAEAVRDPEVRALHTAATRESLSRLRASLRACGVRQGASAMAAGLLSAIEGAYQLSTAAPGVLPVGFAAPMLRRMADGLLAASGASP